MGLHYPRDLQTDIQSREGYFKLKDRFREVVREDFPSYYAISSKNSKVNSKDFENFATRVGIKLEGIEKSEVDLPVNYELIDQIYVTQEGVIDINELRKNLCRDLSHSNVVLHLGTKITCVS